MLRKVSVTSESRALEKKRADGMLSLSQIPTQWTPTPVVELGQH